ncbi:MAG TPA: bifunctional DNA-formamidopyrimidine glycosylase/DNA-(apurinic or apyrimidinic site) lyase [Phycisphaerales bacterium]|nr:bifunctional DNA-formamidopyrimidine glycosylase/DNA-(apurinic or apyrimidinic site) lyase [Phycisphaerales bacterium]
MPETRRFNVSYPSDVAALPELPEIEHLKRTLEPVLVGAAVRRVLVHRSDVIHPVQEPSRKSPVSPRDLLKSCTISHLERLGKQLAICTEEDRVLCIHLGMSGRLIYRTTPQAREKHTHCEWELLNQRDNVAGILSFRDPRRFGGIWPFPNRESLLCHRWAELGPDALTITGPELVARLAGRDTPIKAALLNQAILAGVGNIYADEALFTARIRPNRAAGDLNRTIINTLAKSIRSILKHAVQAGGSTIRDYTDSHGNFGTFTSRHRVYGRAGLPCFRCDKPLAHCLLAQRSTVYCPSCQR